jgi:putative FmdB family regulatory protein
MPNYDYKCLKCKKKFEQFQSMKDEPLKNCIYCKGKVERLIGAGAGFIFKGSGFYATDYKKSGAAPTKSSGKKKEDSPCHSCPAASGGGKKCKA